MTQLFPAQQIKILAATLVTCAALWNLSTSNFAAVVCLVFALVFGVLTLRLVVGPLTPLRLTSFLFTDDDEETEDGPDTDA